MEGSILLGTDGAVEISPGVRCRTGGVYWNARKVGG